MCVFSVWLAPSVVRDRKVRWGASRGKWQKYSDNGPSPSEILLFLLILLSLLLLLFDQIEIYDFGIVEEAEE